MDWAHIKKRGWGNTTEIHSYAVGTTLQGTEQTLVTAYMLITSEAFNEPNIVNNIKQFNEPNIVNNIKQFNEPNILNYIQVKRLAWAGHLKCMNNDRILKKVCNTKTHEVNRAGHENIKGQQLVEDRLQQG